MVDVDEINIQIQQWLRGGFMPFKSVVTIVDENEDVNVSTEFFYSLDIRNATTLFSVEDYFTD